MLLQPSPPCPSSQLSRCWWFLSLDDYWFDEEVQQQQLCQEQDAENCWELSRAGYLRYWCISTFAKLAPADCCSAVACEFLLLVVAKVTCAAAADVVVVGSSLPATTAVQQQLYQQSATGPTFIQGNKQRYCSTVLVSLAFNTCRALCAW